MTVTLQSVRAIVHDDLQSLNQLISTSLESCIPNINLISQHITANQGKRLRPLIAILAAHACGYQGRDHITLAAIIELIHTATLLHDDVVDESTQRRGRATANSKWGNPISVLVGDFLYSRSFQLMAKLNHNQVFKILADTTNIIAEGEVLQLTYSNQSEIDLKTYRNIIHHKTAQLFESAAMLGAVIANAPPSHQQAMRRFGCNFGMAYQIIDDYLDYQGDHKRLGKNTGDDFREGKVTLPLILAMASKDNAQVWHAHIKQDKTMSFDEALSRLQACGALEQTRQQAHSEGQKATQALLELPDSPYRQALLDMVGLTIARDC